MIALGSPGMRIKRGGDEPARDAAHEHRDQHARSHWSALFIPNR